VLSALIPNLAVQVDVARVEPATADQVETTARQLADTNVTLAASDPNLTFHICAAIAKPHNLEFAIIPSPAPAIMADSWNQAADFAMENDVLSESSLFLLASNCPEHSIKGISVHLRGELSELQADPVAKERYIADLKIKLAALHNTVPSDIVIFGLHPGSVVASYAIPPGSPVVVDLANQYQQQFGANYLQCAIHPSFCQLNINPTTFDPRWNRDFRIPGNCPRGERRGGFPYNPPTGWMRFAMNVAGKFAGGDTWLGMSNVAGEWAVVYHGTKGLFVKDITQMPRQPGQRNTYGYGIYCSPNPTIAVADTDEIDMPTAEGAAKLRYMFMCRVNVASVHRCTQSPCPDAQNPSYTVHITPSPDIWFVTCQAQFYQNIRQYGILVNKT
jgi:hypothetical protein